jgi:hypothetical protein
MIAAVIDARLFDRRDIIGFFDHAECVGRPLSVRAHRAGVDVGDVVADRTVKDPPLDFADGLGQPLGLFLGKAQNVEGDALGGFGANAGDPLQFFDELVKGLGVVRH